MKITINDIDVTKYVTLPLTTSLKLDESLDGSVMVLKGTKIEKAFEPLDLVVISYDNREEERWLVAVDTCERQISGEKSFYSHNINLIEETKKLEGVICDTLTFTNPKIVDPKLQNYVVPTIIGGNKKINETIIDTKIFITPEPQNTFLIIPSCVRFFRDLCGLGVQAFITDPLVSGSVETPYPNQYNIDKWQDLTLKLSEIGTYNILYIGYVWHKSEIGIIGTKTQVLYQINVEQSEGNYERPKTTLKDVVNKVILKSKVTNSYETPEYSFNEQQSIDYSKILAPGLTMTRNTLFEALKTVGSITHSIPRLKQNEISFEALEKKHIDEKKSDVTYSNYQSIDQYCDKIDSYVSNMVNENENTGAIFEPSGNMYRTPRTEDGNVLIQDDSVIIQTKYPIQKIVDIVIDEKATDSDGNEHSLGLFNIADYTYEKTRYDLLSSYDGTSFDSKAYALYYIQGQKNIYGMNFQVEDTALPAVFKNFAIKNILDKIALKKGWTVVPFNLVDTRIKVTYIPITNIRVSQHKSYINQIKNSRVLNYSQNENMVSNDAYGENLKGVVLRLGNPETKKTYLVKNISTLPAVGTVFGDKFVSELLTERYKDYIKAVVTLSKDFNRWSQFIGIKSNLRQYEISEKMVYDRSCLYEDFLVIGNVPTIQPIKQNKPLLTMGGINNLKNAFEEIFRTEVTAVRIGIDEDNQGNYLTRLSLPVVSYSMGNSTVFTFEMEDNFKAGSQSVNTYGGFDNYSTKRVQQGAAYGNRWGEFTSFKANFLTYDGDATSTGVTSFANKLPVVDTLDPNIQIGSISNIWFSTDEMQLFIYKDNREAIRFSYQIHCITDKENVIIGSGMGKMFSSLLGYSGYILDRKLKKLGETIDTTGLTPLYSNDSLTVNENFLSLTLPSKVANKQGKSIAFINNATGEFLWGENIDINIGDTITPSVISFRHKKRI